jgi:hypothetical protein
MKKNGVIPVAILGGEDYDLNQIDLDSIHLLGIQPLRWSIEDVATPYEGLLADAYDCHELGGDGYPDLVLKFLAKEVSLALGEVNDGDVILLELTGWIDSESGGYEFHGSDVVKILKK